jgi:hypothetical protein
VGEGSTRTALELGEFEVVAGTPTEREIDARPIFPATVQVHATIDGQPAERAFVEFVRVGGAIATEGGVLTESESGLRVGALVSTLDVHGQATLHGVRIGTLRGFVLDSDGLWSWRGEELHTLAPASAVDVQIPVVTHERDVLVLDAASDQALANFELAVLSDGPSGDHTAVRRTDSEGRVRLRLPAQQIRFASAQVPSANVSPSSVSWIASQSPLVLRIAPGQ